MSSSFPSPKTPNTARAAGLAAWAASAAMLTWVRPAHGAQYFFIPQLELAGEYHSNVDLSVPPPPVTSASGYIADAATIFGIRTPTSETQIRPRVILQSFSGQSKLHSDEEHLDLKSRYTSPLNMFELTANYSRQDTFSSQLAPAQFDSFDPHNPNISGTGLIQVGNLQTQAQIRPIVEHSLSRLFVIGASAVAETTRYQTTLLGAQQDYDYGFGQIYLRRILTPTTDISAGPTFASYTSKSDGIKTIATDQYGVTFDVNHRWTQTFSGRLSAQVQRSDSTGYVPTQSKDRSTDWSLGGNVEYREQTSRVRAYLGRSISPSGIGQLARVDQFRVQYDRDFTQRLSMTAAARYLRYHTIGGATSGYERNYTRAFAAVNWELTRSWYVYTGYTLTLQSLLSGPSTHDNSVGIGIGYEGLGPANRLRIR